jgi:hypothetical protein
MSIHLTEVNGKGNRFNTRWRQNLRQKDIYHNGPYHIQIICHLLDPLDFSLPTTFKEYTEPGARP